MYVNIEKKIALNTRVSICFLKL